MKNKKASMELSVNAIIILVIAIVIMGLILAFINKQFSTISKQLEMQEPEPGSPSASEPIILSRTTITASAGDTVLLKVNIYNPKDLAKKAKPTILATGCSAIGTTDVSGSERLINPGEMEKFIIMFNVPKKIAKDSSYLCQLSAGSDLVAGVTPLATKDLVIKIV